MESNESLALKVINESLKLPFVKVNKQDFLVKIFYEKVENIDSLIEKGPQYFFTKEELDQIAKKRINYITTKSSAISFATGIPGGLAIAATIPADIAQFYGYSLKLAQEISYIYGYKDIWSQQGELTKEAKNTLILYLGIMLGVSSAGSVVRVLSSRLSIQALKKIPQQALTKTIYYPIIKKILAVFGTKLTKNTFAKGISKTVPIIGGVVSGGINFLSMKPMANRLMYELGEGINYSDQKIKRDLKIIDAEGGVVNNNDDLPESTETIIKEIEKAYTLLEKGLITKEEFKILKNKLFSR